MRSAALLLVPASIACAPPTDDVLIIGHRGSPFDAVENSMEGFEIARAAQAEGVELDVQLTRDGRNIVLHDDTLERTTSCEGAVADWTVGELAACTVDNGEPIRTLEEVLALTEGWFQIWFVEIKVADGQSEERVLVQTDEAIDTLLATGYASRIVLISYDDTSLHRIAERQTEGIVGGWDDTSGRSISQASVHDLPWVLMPVRIVEPWMGDITRGLGKQLAVYPVNTPTDVVRASEGGAHAWMTDSISAIEAMIEE